jgi:chromodomain-helicase-DNA-binding protein 4
MSSINGKRARSAGQIDETDASISEDDLSLNQSDTKRQCTTTRYSLRQRTASRQASVAAHQTADLSEESSADEPVKERRSMRTRNGGIRPTGGGLYGSKSTRDAKNDDEMEISNDDDGNRDKKKRPSTGGTRGRGRPKKIQGRRKNDSDGSSFEREGPTRRSGRATKATSNMKERLEDEEMYQDEDVEVEIGPKIISIREIFQPLSSKSEFRNVHNRRCDVCSGAETTSNKGPSPLIHCQGCTTSVHKVCLGYRSNREHMVTKVGDDDFVLQCRRCIGVNIKKDVNAPNHGCCSACKEPGLACASFSAKKTSKHEEKLREENGGKDPITPVNPELLNNASIVLFRCTSCQRGFHFEHLPAFDESSETPSDIGELRNERFNEYSKSWNCKDCIDAPGKVQAMVAWRPANIESYNPGTACVMTPEDDKEYLIKWEGKSYFECTWMPGAWVYGITAAAMRSAFLRRDEQALPKMTAEDAIPEEFLRIEIVLDVKYSSRVKTHTEEIDKARVKEVDRAFAKFQGLGYDEVAWVQPPNPNETERWDDFVAAYNEYVAGKYFKQQQPRIKERMEEYRSLNFQNKLLMHEQPASLTGGQIMPYQLEGMNWLLYNFHQQKNVILADEMGLGKTIQVIATLAALIKEKPKCWPFLIVVPNSTCPNWRREIKKWAPSLRVVAYYGLRQAREMAMKYELYPDNCNDMRAHIVVTSYDAPVDDYSRHFFHKIKWAGLIVDEGQRLKNDKNLLYGALSSLKIPFRVLLTGLFSSCLSQVHANKI